MKMGLRLDSPMMETTRDMQITLAPDGCAGATNHYQLIFLGEGAANIVYRITRSSDRSTWMNGSTCRYSGSTLSVQVLAAAPESICDKLLRVSKVSTTKTHALESDSISTPTTTEDEWSEEEGSEQGLYNMNAIKNGPAASLAEERGQLHFYETVIKACFDSKHIIGLEPVLVRPDVIATMNNDLESLEMMGLARPGSRIPDCQPEAFFVTDMTSKAAESFSLEVKPKWLMQSPNAPLGAKRCRTCALKSYRKKVGTAQGFCPLKLMSGDPKSIRSVIQTMIKNNPFKEDSQSFYSRSQKDQEQILHRLVAFFSTGGEGRKVLCNILKYQKRFDPNGVLSMVSGQDADQDSLHSLGKAMTFRDCSMFIKVYWDGRDIELRLGDLDLKKSAKLNTWASIERTLNDGGWYWGRDLLSDCFLANQPA